jgi:hypothetical protein
MRFKKPKRIKDVVRSTPKFKSGKTPKAMPATTHPNRIKNLGKFAHPPSKFPKMGVTVKAKRKSNKVKGY